MVTNYKDYYKNHYKSSFSQSDIDRWCDWFTGEWKYISKKLNLEVGIRVLDIGCGFGGFFEILRREGINADYVGLDLDPEIVDFSNKHFKGKHFQFEKFENHKSKKKYDLIVAFEVLEHVESPSAFITLIAENLKSDGIFCGTTPYPFRKNIVSDKTHISVLHPKNWEKLFINSGFKDISTTPMSFVPGLWRIHPKINIRIPAYISIPGFVSTCCIMASK